MGRINSGLRWGFTSACVVAAAVLQPFFGQSVQAITASVGQPYHGRLVDGIPFPTQFPGYQVREEGRTYTTPEVVGAVLDAIDSVREKFPDTCDVYLGDFSLQGGGGSSHHRSHQNGRDVDIGLYHKGNQPLSMLHVMNSENLDAAKTWCLVEGLIRSQRVQYIFLDRSIQRLLFDYALSQGVDQAYLDQLFANAKGSIFQHVRNHIDHMHVRFFTPWSTLAAHIDESEAQKLRVIEMAQQAYLPKRVNYYVNGTEPGLDALAKSFGVTGRDLCRWNQIRGNTVLPPGSCLVFYKRNFEAEPVHLAQSLQPYAAPIAPVRLASLNPEPVGPPSESSETVASDASPQVESEPAPKAGRSTRTAPLMVYSSYKVRSGDTLEKLAQQNGIDVKTLCRLNGMRRSASLKPGRTIRIASLKSPNVPSGSPSFDVPACSINASARGGGKAIRGELNICTVGKGDTLDKVAKRHNIRVESLCKLNGLRKTAALHPGQKLNLSKPDKSSKSARDLLKPSHSNSHADGSVSGRARTGVEKQKATQGKSSAKAKPARSFSRDSPAAAGVKPAAAAPAALKKSSPAEKRAGNAKTVKKGVN